MYKKIKQNLLNIFKNDPFGREWYYRHDIGIEVWLKKEFDPFVPFEADFSYKLEEMIPENAFGIRFDEVPQNQGHYIIDKEVTVESFPKPERTTYWIPELGDLAKGVYQSPEGEIYKYVPYSTENDAVILQGNYTVNKDWDKARKTGAPFIENIDLIIDQIKDNIKGGELDYLMITKESLGAPDQKYYPDYIPDKARIRVFPNMSLPIERHYPTKLVYPKIKAGNPPIEISSKAKYTINSALKDKEITQCLILNGGNHKKLTAIPEKIRQLKNLRKLVIKEIPIKEIPAWIKDLKELRSLTISPCKEEVAQLEDPCLINEIPDELWELNNLQYLSIRNTNIKKISKNIEQLTNLIELDISENQLIDLPSSIGKLKNLERLEVTSSIPYERTEYYYNEKPLRKSWVNIDSINEGLSEDEYLEKYNVEIRTNNDIFSGLTNIPKSISQLKKLTYLDLSGNKELQLSDEIGKLTELREFKIVGMDLKKIPEGIQNNIKLHTLSIAENPNIKEIPVWIDKLQNLAYLRSYGCRFSVIPETLNKLDMPSLKNGQEIFAYINLSELPSLFLRQKRNLIKKWSESIEKLPDWIGMLSESIYNISIRRNNSKIKFTELPDSFGDLINLQIISFEHHDISELPDSMKNLTNTTEIYLDDNKLTELPELIKYMKKLKVLSFAYNNIKEVPEWINKFKNLRRLNVSEITEKIPDSILKLKKLTDKRIDHSQEAYAKKFPGL
jgi:Leucine-rich repeat (LRR) protein